MAEANEIRPFDWRDLPLLHRVRDRGVCLDSQLAHTRGPSAMQHALLDLVTPGRASYTLVSRPSDGPAVVGQFALRLHEQAKVTFVSPGEALNDDGGMRMLEALAHAAGSRGAHNLVAEVDEDSEAFVTLRQAGFAIYARQRIWRLTPSSRGQEESGAWRIERHADASAVHSLYANTVPVLVQQVEPAPSGIGRCLVHQPEDEVLGYLDVESGPLGVWIQPYFHPAAEQLDRLLTNLERHFGGVRDRPVLVCVRSYQGWVNGALERLGFVYDSDQAVMVKRLAAAVRRPATSPLTQLEGRRVEPTAPFMNIEQQRTTGAGTKR